MFPFGNGQYWYSASYIYLYNDGQTGQMIIGPGGYNYGGNPGQPVYLRVRLSYESNFGYVNGPLPPVSYVLSTTNLPPSPSPLPPSPSGSPPPFVIRPLHANQTVNGALMAPTQIDFYNITIPNNHRVQLTLMNVS